MTLKIFGVDVELDEFIPVTIPPDNLQITQVEYLGAIQSTVRIPPADLAFYKKLTITETDANLHRWIVKEKSVYNGAWAKRLRKWAKLKAGINLNPDALSRISEHLSKASSTEEMYLKFTKTLWSPGTYGDAGSCWFKLNSMWGHCSAAVMENGGGLLFFDRKQEPRGRMWFYSLKDGEEGVIFNVYDLQKRMTLLNMSRILSSLYGISYHRVTDLKVPDGYVNGQQSSAFLLGKSPVLRPIRLYFATMWEPLDETLLTNNYVPTCWYCGAASTVTYGDNEYCDECKKNRCVLCGTSGCDENPVCFSCNDSVWKCCGVRNGSCQCGKRERWIP